jgi:hypothetical protein
MAKSSKFDVNSYLSAVISKKKLIPISLKDKRLRPIMRILDDWKGDEIAAVKHSGSSAKGTGLKGSADLDIFISLKASASGTLCEIYDSLFDSLGLHSKELGIIRRRQNVSIRIWYVGLKIDLVPAKKVGDSHTLHNLHVRRDKKNRTLTNVDLHINLVKNSGRIDEIVLAKIWRQINGLDFPSIYLELTVIAALKGKRSGNLERNFQCVLDYLASDECFVESKVLDPANASNVLSNSITKGSKRLIAKTARQSLADLPNWRLVVK